jgi:putative tryptophan/tyrosine transport system substrate-binding protein
MRASAQQPTRLPRVALVYSVVPVADMQGADPVNPSALAFMHALRDIGLVDGRNIVVERWSAEGQYDRLVPLMRKVVASNVDVIVTVGSPVAIAAQSATNRIPIVALARMHPPTGSSPIWHVPAATLPGTVLPPQRTPENGCKSCTKLRRGSNA